MATWKELSKAMDRMLMTSAQLIGDLEAQLMVYDEADMYHSLAEIAIGRRSVPISHFTEAVRLSWFGSTEASKTPIFTSAE